MAINNSSSKIYQNGAKPFHQNSNMSASSDEAIAVVVLKNVVSYTSTDPQIDIVHGKDEDSGSDLCGDTSGRVSPRGPCHENAGELGPSAYVCECDACPYCDDTCDNPFCVNCTRKRDDLRSSSLSGGVNCDNHVSPLGGLFGCPSEGGEKMYTLCQLKRHNHTQSAWLLAGDTIYDATNYIARHPGGSSSILRKSGGTQDCSEDMKFHSKSAVKLWKRNKVGKLRRCPGMNVVAKNGSLCRKDNVSRDQCTIC